MDKQAILSLMKKEQTDSLALYINQGETEYLYFNQANKESIFEAASLTKSVFCLEVMKLVNQGILQLDKPIIQYGVAFKKCSNPWFQEITIRQLLSHSAGFKNWSEEEDWPMYFPPGSLMCYAGEGYVYIQKVVEHILQKDIEQVMIEDIFKPLQMHNSYFVYHNEFAANLIPSYNRKLVLNQEYEPIAECNAAYSLYTTIEDYQKFVDYLIKHTKEYLPMTKTQIRIKDNYGWALGLGNIKNRFGFQWGDTKNFKNLLLIDFQEKKSLLGFTNSDNGMHTLIPIFQSYYPAEVKEISDFLINEYSDEGHYIHGKELAKH